MSISAEHRQVVFTIKGKCRVCYTCVRECPAKAIKIAKGQAEVIPERCIGCGICTKVCKQHAKIYLDSTLPVDQMLQSNEKVVAIVDSSFSAEFDKIDCRQFVGMLKKMGFYKVADVAFGADIISELYKAIFKNNSTPKISANCPAIVNYIRQFHPDLVKSLAAVDCPSGAMAKIIRKEYPEIQKVIFIGPCVAKKARKNIFDETLTFRELRKMLHKKGIQPHNTQPQAFDPPIGGKGALSAVRRGLMQTVGIEDNVLEGNVIVANGRVYFQDAIREFENGLLENQHLDLFCCEGCIMGPGMTGKGRQYARRIKVRNYVKNKVRSFDVETWKKNIQKYSQLNFHREYTINDRRFPLPAKSEINAVLKSMGKSSLRDHLDCKACGYDSCLEHAIAITRGLAEVEMCLPYSIEKLHNSVKELAESNKKLVSVQRALKQSEKMAGMGQLSAGIAHELNNPLGVVIMYSNILREEAEQNSDIAQDLKLIVEQAERCKKIVRGLLNFARKNQIIASEVDIKKLTEQSLGSIIIPDEIELNIVPQCKNPIAMLDTEQMIQVLTNLIKNAIEAMPEGGRLHIKLSDTDDEIIFEICDTGPGIEKDQLEKIFEPFYTTKDIGKGTGLGLATTYGIVKMHKGQINVTSNTDPAQGPTGTCFKVKIPRNVSLK